MNRTLSAAFILLIVVTFTITNVTAQKTGTNYKTALGLGIDFGDGGTYAGPSFKYFFTKNNVGKAEVLFGDFATMLSLYY